MPDPIGNNPHEYGTDLSDEEMTEQDQSSDSEMSEAHASTEEHSGVPEGARRQAQPPASMAGTPNFERLMTTLPRLWTRVDMGHDAKDEYSPTTPTEEVMRQYADENNLPGPTGHSEQFTRDGSVAEFTHFGSVEVPSAHAEHYVKLRQHMAKALKGKKYLAVAENREDVKAVVLPYSARLNREALEGAPLQPVVRTQRGVKKVIAIVPTDEASFTSDGEFHSAATLGAHEMAHVARVVANPETGMPEHPPKVPYPSWTDTEEHYTVGVENAIARANGEAGKRDTHGGAGLFLTDDIHSTTPVDPLQRETIEKYRRQLQDLTQKMDGDRIAPRNLDEPIAIERANVASWVNANLSVHRQMPKIKSMVESGKSLDEIAADMKLREQQKEVVRRLFWPTAQQ
jgi:hypothetical protein